MCCSGFLVALATDNYFLQTVPSPTPAPALTIDEVQQNIFFFLTDNYLPFYLYLFTGAQGRRYIRRHHTDSPRGQSLCRNFAEQRRRKQTSWQVHSTHGTHISHSTDSTHSTYYIVHIVHIVHIVPIVHIVHTLNIVHIVHITYCTQCTHFIHSTHCTHCTHKTHSTQKNIFFG